MINILVLFSLLTQAGSAEEIFTKIEESIQKAERLSIDYSGKVHSPQAPPESVIKLSGTLLIKNAGMARMNLKIDGAGKAVERQFCSDGVNLCLTQTGSDSVELSPMLKNTPVNLRNRLNVVLSRVGITLSSVLVREPQLFTGPDDPLAELKKKILVSKFSNLEGENGTRAITYTLHLVGSTWKDLSCTLWYDPKTNKPLRRIVKLSESQEIACEDVYDKWDTEKEIAEDQFKLPSPKK